MTEMTMDRFRVGAIFGRAFEILSRNFAKFFLLTAIVWSPYLLLMLYLTASGDASPGRPDALVTGALVFVLLIVLGILSQAVILYGTFQDMRHQPFDIEQSLAKGLTRFFPIIGLSICAGIAISFGFILLIVPGLMLATIWFVATPVCIVEGLGAFASLSRSASLTEGNRWKVFGILILLAIAANVASAIVEFLLTKLAGATAASVGQFAWKALTGAYQSIVVAIVYHDLRAAKEGVDIDRIAAVFD